ncbi:MAG: gas vesicle protein GvpG [Chloroflexota bacterium]
MFLLDDILLAPVHGFAAICREIQQAADQEIGQRAETIRTHLSELYLLLESGQATEEEFEAAEKELLDQLDALESPEEE